MSADHKSKTFSFTFENKTYKIPSFGSIPAGALRKSRHAKDDIDKAFTILENALGIDSKELAALDCMTTEEFGDFIKDWTGGVAVGESSDS